MSTIKQKLGRAPELNEKLWIQVSHEEGNPWQLIEYKGMGKYVPTNKTLDKLSNPVIYREDQIIVVQELKEAYNDYSATKEHRELVKRYKNGKLENVWSEGTYVLNLSQIKDQEFLNDLNTLFGDKLLSIVDTSSPAKIAYSMNAFSSISEAKKNGLPSTLPKEVGFYDYYLSVPFGYSASKHTIKYKTSFTIYIPPIEKASEQNLNIAQL